MRRSDTIADLVVALVKAQAQFKATPKTGKNPMFKSNYSTFDDIVGAVRGPLAEAGLSYAQMLDDVGGAPALTTTLMHTSGQWIDSTTPLVIGAGNRGTNEVQALGSALTYMKRYALAAMLGVASDEDDDGNGTHKPQVQRSAAPQSDEPPDLWDEEEQDGGAPSFVADTVKVLMTQKNTPYLMFTAGEDAASWFKGRDELLKAAPWIGTVYTKDDFQPGTALPLSIRVEYEVSGQYRNAVAFAKA